MSRQSPSIVRDDVRLDEDPEEVDRHGY
jgi:hypothetical protein